MKVYFVIPSDKGREFVREQEFFETLTGKFNVVPKVNQLKIMNVL